MNAIRKKEPGAEVENLIFYQDNDPPHRCNESLMTVYFLGYTRFYHARYSLDLAPFDFAFFPRQKDDLRGNRY